MIQMNLFTKQKKKTHSLKEQICGCGVGCGENEGKGQ